MYAVVRNYSGSGAKELVDLLEERKSEVESLIRAVSGFVGYLLIRTNEGGVTKHNKSMGKNIIDPGRG